MTHRDWTPTVDLMVRAWGPRVDKAALAFEARWSRSALRKHSPKLAHALQAAHDQFASAMDVGSSADIENAGTRLCRSYAMVSAALQNANMPDDAYMIGRDPESGLEVIIAASPAAAKRALQVHPFAKWFTPDEFARLISLSMHAHSRSPK